MCVVIGILPLIKEGKRLSACDSKGLSILNLLRFAPISVGAQLHLAKTFLYVLLHLSSFISPHLREKTFRKRKLENE